MKDALHIVTKLKLPFWARLAFLLGWSVDVRIRVPTHTQIRIASDAESEVHVDRPKWLSRLFPERVIAEAVSNPKT